MSRRREDTSIPPANKRTFLGRLVVTYFQMSALRIVCPRGKKTRCLTTFMFTSVRLCPLACRWLMEAIDCIGCKPWQKVFPTRAMYLERYYYVYGVADYLTPMRLYDLCRADEDGKNDDKS